jgi:GNAT superfamily N-acetyltransferase
MWIDLASPPLSHCPCESETSKFATKGKVAVAKLTSGKAAEIGSRYDALETRQTRGGEVAVIKFSYAVPLEQTMVFETVYHPGLQLDLAQKQEVWDTPGAFFVWMIVDGQLAGESYGIPLASASELIEDLLVLPESEKEKAVCCFSNTILPAFQKQGYGSILKAHWLGLAAGKGFDVVYGHARPGGSQALNAKFGAVFLESLPDWFGSGEDYRKYRLVLHSKTLS